MYRKLIKIINEKDLFIFSLIIIILGAAGFIFVNDLENVIDIKWDDEGYYLYGGRFFFLESFPAWFGKLYSFWYWLLHLFQSDPVLLYYLNYKLMTILPPIGLFILLSKGFNVNYLISAIISLTFLISLSNVTVWPKVSHFTMLFIFLILLLVLRQRSVKLKFFIALPAIFLLIYIRPEFIVTLIILIIVFTYYLLSKRVKTQSLFFYLGFIIVMATLLTIWLGFPYSGERSFGAFQQHFAFVDQFRFGGNFDPWSEHEIVMSKKFPGAKSVTEAIFIKPSAVLSHIGFNLSRYPELFIDRLTEIFIPKVILSLPFSYRIIILFWVVLIVAYIWFAKNTFMQKLKEICQNYRQFKFEIFLCFTLFLPSLISSIMYYPREHYLIIQTVLFIILISPILSSILRFNHLMFLIVLLISVFSLFLTINPNAKNYFYKNDQSLKTTIDYLTNLKQDGQLNLLETHRGLIFFLPDNFRYFDVNKIDESFENYIKKIDIVYFNLKSKNEYFLNAEPEWENFIKNFQSYGFNQVSVGYGYPMFIRTNLLIK